MAATEVRCGIKLSPCSIACPSGTMHLHLPPSGLISVSSSAVAPLSVGLASRPSLDLFAYIRQTTLPGWTRPCVCLLSMLPTTNLCQPPFDGGPWLILMSYLRRHKSTMVVFCCFDVASSHFLYCTWRPGLIKNPSATKDEEAIRWIFSLCGPIGLSGSL